jgi:hypothetical protein
MDRRRLMLLQLAALVLALIGVAIAATPITLLAGMLAVGLLGTAMTQGLIAYAATAAAPEERGRIVGTTQGGVVIGLLLARDENDQPLVRGRRITAVTDKQVEELGISITPQHPERELRAAGAKFESATAFRDMFANHVVVDGRIVSGQNQNAGAEVANMMMKVAGGTRR